MEFKSFELWNILYALEEKIYKDKSYLSNFEFYDRLERARAEIRIQQNIEIRNKINNELGKRY